MCAILKVNRLTPTSWILDTLKWLNIRERLQINTIYLGDAPGSTLQFEKRQTSEFNKLTLTLHQGRNRCFIKD